MLPGSTYTAIIICEWKIISVLNDTFLKSCPPLFYRKKPNNSNPVGRN